MVVVQMMNEVKPVEGDTHSYFWVIIKKDSVSKKIRYRVTNTSGIGSILLVMVKIWYDIRKDDPKEKVIILTNSGPAIDDIRYNLEKFAENSFKYPIHFNKNEEYTLDLPGSKSRYLALKLIKPYLGNEIEFEKFSKKFKGMAPSWDELPLIDIDYEEETDRIQKESMV